MSAYYNENDPACCAWLRELIKHGHIADGVVDERSIEDVTPNDLREFTQCHFFAGVGIWSYALRQAGVSDDEPLWSGSCPCQPFSAAGQGGGFADERHLWPSFHWLIQQSRPVRVFGEQVAGKDGETWFDLVSTDLEMEGYTVGATIIPACGVGAPNQRKRIYWVADTEHNEHQRRIQKHSVDSKTQGSGTTTEPPRHSTVVRVAHTDSLRQSGSSRESKTQRLRAAELRMSSNNGQTGSTDSFWSSVEWIGCRDNKFRPVEPGTFPLVDGAPSELVSDGDLSIEDTKSTKEANKIRLKGYGNGLNAEQARAFIEAYYEGQ